MPANFSPDDVDAFRKALNVSARVKKCVLCVHIAHACSPHAQDRTGDATSGRQKQPVYVTRVEVVQKQTLWNYQAR